MPVITMPSCLAMMPTESCKLSLPVIIHHTKCPDKAFFGTNCRLVPEFFEGTEESGMNGADG